ncbi:hypothetical protein DIZ81_09540 [Legionella taurinensis]|uniref:Uncharacterized protein n=1 Tax=Legionella taurinensis TaxID=70611 RepID=A0A3A5L4X1_9GAMM|nr:hypothetical protein [Legionella taurinensis]MDX1838036.1 hypothetical protein [Legionella taurinensis]PUT39379.1 hypothetical protein DB744_09550 [Legionella taurinensis]PUT41688.1 hypothetical protein DB746_08465 [Legionella taurinensis]PUT44522.1 hypothetical protein DB743_07680 [Legionella taurinensis]PUT46766.1 hypothetical protein DB745_09545 [Legionella taurinensis]
MAKIINNLEKFTQGLIDLISDNSEAGKKKLEELFAKAHADYDEPKQSYVWRWIYQYSRQRSDNFNKAETDLKLPDPLLRLQTLLVFISGGNWTSTSANTRLLLGLIKAVPGYDKETDEYLRTRIIDALTPLLKEQITLVVKTQQNEIAVKAARQRELDLINQRKEKELDEIALFDKEDDARAFAAKKTEKYAVYFVKNKTSWYMGWYDSTGKKELLLANKELQTLLAKSLNVDDKTIAKIKAQCRILLESFLDKINLLINPEPKELEGLASAFTLDEKTEALTWYDSLGRTHAIDLKKYPMAYECSKTRDLSDENNALFFKSLLLRVSTRHAVDNEKQKSLLQLMQKRFSCELLFTNELPRLPAPRLGAYILTREKSLWVLYQWQDGAAKAVNTDAWEEYHTMLDTLGNIEPEAVKAEDKEKLRGLITKLSRMPAAVRVEEAVKPVSKINVAQFAELEKCLGGHVAKVKGNAKDEKETTHQHADKKAVAEKKKQLVSKFSAVATLFGAQVIDEYRKPVNPVMNPVLIDDYLPPPPPVENPDSMRSDGEWLDEEDYYCGNPTI